MCGRHGPGKAGVVFSQVGRASSGAHSHAHSEHPTQLHRQAAGAYLLIVEHQACAPALHPCHMFSSPHPCPAVCAMQHNATQSTARGEQVDQFFGANEQQLRDHIWLASQST